MSERSALNVEAASATDAEDADMRARCMRTKVVLAVIGVAGLVALVVLGRGPAGDGPGAGSDLKIWMMYVKEELICFRPGEMETLIAGEVELLGADMVVLHQLSHRPSAADMERDEDKLDFNITSCESLGGVPLDAQMAAKLPSSMELVQILQYAEDDPLAPDQGLLSIWYDPAKVTPGAALAYKNKFEVEDTTKCEFVGQPKMGSVPVFYDAALRDCPEWISEVWPRYDSSKSSLAVSWQAQDGIEPFAIYGVNLPSKYEKGKNQMLLRAMTDIENRLNVSAGRVIVIGDLNTRLLLEAWDACGNSSCTPEFSAGEEAQLVEKCEDWLEEDFEPAADGYASAEECEAARAVMAECRSNCLAAFACDASTNMRLGAGWELLDPKRGAGGFDLLATYFQFPQDRVFREESFVDYRLPTYKKALSAEVPACQPDRPFVGTCTSSPCAFRRKGTCQSEMSGCYQSAGDIKADGVPDADPVQASRGQRLVNPQVGWLDSFGFSKDLAGSIVVRSFQDVEAFTAGDHGAFSASLTFATAV